MMYRVALIVLSVFMSISTLFAENNSDEPKTATQNNCVVSGIVVDNTTGEALAGVKVKIEESNLEVYTNFEGKFEFTNLKEGNYSLSCNMVTYEGFKIENIKIGSEVKDSKVMLKLIPVTEKSVLKREVPMNNNMLAVNVG